jgi:cytochrome c biogenesis protein CcmG, thiol:disulfide interchange protein DsbE
VNSVLRGARAAAVLLVAALLGLLVWRVVYGNDGRGLVDAIARGDAPSAPSFSLPVVWRPVATWPAPLRQSVDDGPLSLPELRGYPVVINFWASWCVPCKEEAPFLADSSRAHSGQVASLGIDVQDLTADARRFLRTLDVPYVSVRDSGPKTFSSYGLTGLPETYYLDRRARIVAHSIGRVSRLELERELAKALGG